MVAAAFSPEGALAPAWPGFEPREGQRLMAQAIADMLETGGTILAEAGTGTGKTLAYLIPTILSGQRVLISTGTKNLQEQIYFKDLPAIASALGVRFTATLMKGRSNYLCLHRLHNVAEAQDAPALFDRGGRDNAERAVFLPVITEWAAATTTGDRAELRDLPEDLPLWGQISAEAETCLGAECPRYNDCFVTQMRQRAAESDVVIVNHHLLCADAAVRHGSFGEVIPSCPTLVVDEAHQLEDVATNYFGVTFSNYRVEELVRDGDRVLSEAHAARRRNEDGQWTLRQIEDIARAVARVSEHSRRFFDEIGVARSLNGVSTEARIRYTAATMAEPLESGLALAGALEGVEAALALAQQATLTPDPELSAQAETLGRRAGELHQDLRVLLRGDDPDLVYALETRGRGVFLRASPVDVSRLVREAVFDRFRTVVLTSATLAVDNSFDYVKGRLGIRASDELRVPSEFDYERQALIYLPRRMPAPKSPDFADAVARETIEILRRSKGRAFVLFTSYAMLRSVQPAIEDALEFPGAGAGPGAPVRADRALSHDAERGAAGHVQLLAGRGRGGRRAELRGDRQAALRRAQRPDHIGPDRRHQRARRRRLRRLSGAAGDPGAAAGLGPADPPPAGPRRAGGARPADSHHGLRTAVFGRISAGAGDPGSRCGGSFLRVSYCLGAGWLEPAPHEYHPVRRRDRCGPTCSGARWRWRCCCSSPRRRRPKVSSEAR